MTVLDVVPSTENLTLTMTATFNADVEQVWQLWENPRLVERWWGPPTHPATVTNQDFTPDGRLAYFMTGPDGDRFHGWWRFVSIDRPRALEIEDGFADAEGKPNADMPTTRMYVTLTPETESHTSMTIITTFSTLEAMQEILDMGVAEGMTQAVGQMDALLD